jgi:hypothetical protein
MRKWNNPAHQVAGGAAVAAAVENTRLALEGKPLCQETRSQTVATAQCVLRLFPSTDDIVKNLRPITRALGAVLSMTSASHNRDPTVSLGSMSRSAFMRHFGNYAAALEYRNSGPLRAEEKLENEAYGCSTFSHLGSIRGKVDAAERQLGGFVTKAQKLTYPLGLDDFLAIFRSAL